MQPELMWEFGSHLVSVINISSTFWKVRPTHKRESLIQGLIYLSMFSSPTTATKWSPSLCFSCGGKESQFARQAGNISLIRGGRASSACWGGSRARWGNFSREHWPQMEEPTELGGWGGDPQALSAWGTGPQGTHLQSECQNDSHSL